MTTIYYFDNNAYWKYHQGRNERGYLNLRRLVSQQSQPIWLSPLTILEFFGVLAKAWRSKQVRKRDFKKITKAVKREINHQSGSFTVIPMPAGIYREAERVLLTYPQYSFGTVDALHIATVKILQQTTPNLVMVTSDGRQGQGRLKQVCREDGIAFYDPEITSV